MGTQAGVGISHHRNPRVAGREAAQAALATAGITQPDFVFMFGSVGYDQEALLAAVREATGRAPLAGCSGEGIIGQGECDESNFSVAVMAIASDEMRFDHTVVTGLAADSEAAGREAAGALRPLIGPDAAALFVFPDGITVNYDRMVAGLNEALGQRLPLFGGTAADNFVWEKTYQYYDDQVVSDGMTCVLLSGAVRFAWEINHSCFPLGTARTVTRSTGNVIHEIDGKPVMDVIKEYLPEGEWGQIIGNLPLGFTVPRELGGYDEYVVRVISSQVEDGITLPTDVPEGAKIWVMRRDQEKIASGAEELAQRIKTSVGGGDPKMVFQFDCAGRGKIVLREQQKADTLAKFQETIGRSVPWIGFYCFGEIGPVGEQNFFHNWTAIVLALY
jgi:hypothetical protein